MRTARTPLVVRRSLWFIVGTTAAIALSLASATAAPGPQEPGGSGASTPAPDDESSASANGGPRWFRYDRPASFGAVTESVAVPTRDGFELGCALTRPAVDGQPAAGRFPGIVSDYTPYGLVAAEPSDYARFLAEHGYVVLVCDIRGTGASPGAEYEYPMPIQADDGYDIVEWLGVQEFSSGEVGMSGTSYGGYTTLQVAALQPPHLTAISPTVPPMDTYHEIFYPGGVPGGVDWQWVYGPAVADPAFPQRQLDTFAAHPDFDDYWSSQSLAGTHDAIDVPVLIWGGWFDVFRAGEIKHFRRLRAAGNDRAWAVMGPWVHANTWEQSMEPIGLGAHLAWFDHWLQDRPSAPLPGAALTSYEWSGASGSWRRLTAFPADAQRRSLAFTRTGGLRPDGGKSATLTNAIDPTDGPATTCLVGCLTPLDPESDNKRADRRRLTFTSAKLRRAQRLLGTVRVQLRIALPNLDGNLVAKLMDVAPNGTVTEVAAGWIRASHRLGDHRQVPVTPGRMETYVLRTQPSHWTFGKKHRLRVSVTTGDVPRIASDGSEGRIRIRVGEGGSRVKLPLRALR